MATVQKVTPATQLQEFKKNEKIPVYSRDFNALVDAVGVGVKIYEAILVQSGGDAPVATVLNNTLGAPIVFTRSAAGQYIGTLVGAFTANKRLISITGGSLIGLNLEDDRISYFFNDTDSFGIQTFRQLTDTTTSAGEDDLMYETNILIKVYP